MDKYEQAMRILGFGDSECTTEDPVEYAKRWVQARLQEDIARADYELRLRKVQDALAMKDERLDELRRPPQPPRANVVDLRGVPDDQLTRDQLRWRMMSRGENTGSGVGIQKF